MTLLDVQNLFNTDDKCREVLVKLRWPAGVECPRCHGKKISWIKANKQFDCSECEYHFSVLAGTVFNDSHLPLTTWFTAVLLIVEAKKGMSALQLSAPSGEPIKAPTRLHGISAIASEQP